MWLSSSTVTGRIGPGTAFSRTILAQNCINGTIFSQGHNLSSDDSRDFDGTGDLNNIDPMLGRLHNNGGPTAGDGTTVRESSE